ncbi:hypothetical protein B296_00058831, partial [Ensete ventricosum]
PPLPSLHCRYYHRCPYAGGGHCPSTGSSWAGVALVALPRVADPCSLVAGEHCPCGLATG